MAQATRAVCLKVIQTAMQYLHGEDKEDDSNLTCSPYQIKSFTAGLVAGVKISRVFRNSTT